MVDPGQAMNFLPHYPINKRYQERNIMQSFAKKNQIVELGNASALTLGMGGNSFEMQIQNRPLLQ